MGYVPVDYPEKACRHCRQVFKPRRNNHLYCTVECRDRYWDKVREVGLKEVANQVTAGAPVDSGRG